MFILVGISDKAEVDESFIQEYKYCLQTNGYVARKVRGEDGKRKKIPLHLDVWDYYEKTIIPKGKTIDHKDRNPLNNKMENLRLATPLQQNLNKGPIRGAKYKGVFFYKARSKFRVKYKKAGKTIQVGMFINELEAVVAYNKAILEAYAGTPEQAFVYVNPL